MARIRPTRGNGAQQPTRGVAAEELRRHNLGTVLGRLHRLGSLSRSDLTAFSGLNRSTIADLIGELTALGLVTEGPGATGAGPGRPSPVVSVRPAGAVVLALEIDVDSIGAATIGLGGHVYGRQRSPHPRRHQSAETAVRNAARLAQPLLDALPGDHQLVGAAVGVAGITRTSDGFVHLAPNLGWRDVPLGDLISAEFDLERPPVVANEADLGAVGELRRGVRPGVRHLVYVSGEVGIGAGIIVDGELLRGLAGYAGEAGHTVVNPSGLPCRCGSVGCWETEAGEAALMRRVGAPEGAGGLESIATIVRRAAAGDSTTLEAIAHVGHWLGIGIGNLINVFNPEVVVLGGLYEQLFTYVEPAVVDAVQRGGLDAPATMATIVPSSLGADAPLIGAAESMLADVIADPASVRGAAFSAR